MAREIHGRKTRDLHTRPHPAWQGGLYGSPGTYWAHSLRVMIIPDTSRAARATRRRSKRAS
ncbi:hypothetical protein [Nonomuraea jabiensis]|uniref:hypothetical protein n=1 Tax=Nonomuraea jabiensis TaxID=882448 RepID=UPI003D706279